MGVYSKQHRLRARFDGKDLAFGWKRIVVSEEVRHLWNNQIAEPNSENGSSSPAKGGTFDDVCIPS